jgi:hypothetical protein
MSWPVFRVEVQRTTPPLRPSSGRAGVLACRVCVGERFRPKIFDGLAGMVHLRLAVAGHATPDIAWSGHPGLALPEAWEEGMDDALDAAVADTPDTAPCAPCSQTRLTQHRPA